MPVQPQHQRKGWALPPTEEDELDEDKLEAPIHLNTNFSSFVVVDHVPQVPVEKYEKLKAVLSKIVTGLAGNFVQLILPQDEKKNTKGYAFVEFSTAEAAQTAIDKVDGYKLDKDHIFKVSTFDDFQKYLNVPEEYVAPEIPPYQPRENLRSWVLDERAIDQYVIRYGDVTEILWNELKPSYGEDQESVLRREGFTDIYASWSPLGSYLATLHAEGVAIWGGPDFKKLGKFPHSNVRVVDFSPCEKYLITASSLYQENDDPKNPQCVIVWDVRTGARLRGFLGQMVKIKDPKDGKDGKELQWPAFKWSHDDKYFARLTEDTISVYETPSMDLLDKKSIKIPGVKDFCWSPSENIISYFVPEANNNNKPTSVVLIDIPSRSPRSQKNLFNVSDCKLYWHPSGDYLCVKVDRLTKTKKSVLTDFVFFRMREKGIPIEVVEIKETITSFAWEPKGTKFAVLHGESARADVSFYSMDHKVKLLKTLEKKPVNQLLWSPQGGFIVLAGVGTLNGTFEFFNANELETMATEEHFNASLVEWDPSGRYVSTCVTFWRHQVENGYHIYSFQGKLLKNVLKEKFYQLNWRPRPPSLLPKERIEYIRKNIKEFAKQLKAEDRKKIEKEREKRRAKRAALRQDFERILRKNKQIYEEEATKRRELRFGEESDNEEDYEVREQWVEEIQDIQEIVINED